MASITQAVAEHRDSLLFVCDFSPPRGRDDAVFDRIRAIDADFISVAYNPGKAARVNSAFAARWLEEHAGKGVTFTLATRDMNKLAAQSLLLGADLLGLENVVVLQGDRFSERELESVASVDDFRPTELLRSIQAMNDGVDYRGGKLRSPTNLCAGAALDLGHGLEREVQLTRRKVEAGAQFFLMQPVFDVEAIAEFLDRYAETLTTPLFCGVQVMTPESIVFGSVPAWVTGDLEKGRPGQDIATDLLGQFVDGGFRTIYLVPPILRGGRRDYETAQLVIEAARS